MARWFQKFNAIYIVGLTLILTGCAGAALNAAIEAQDPDMLLKFQEEYPAESDDEDAIQRVERAKEVRNRILWDRAVSGGPEALRGYIRDSTNPLKDVRKAKEVHDKQLMVVASKSSGWKALETYPDNCLTCTRKSKAEAINQACLRRMESLQSEMGSAVVALGYSDALEFSQRCSNVQDQSVSQSAQFVGVGIQTLKADKLPDRVVRAFLAWGESLNSAFGAAATAVLRAQLLKAVSPRIISHTKLAMKRGALSSSLTIGCSLEVSKTSGKLLLNRLGTDVAACGQGGVDIVCLKPSAASAISDENACDLNIREAKMALGGSTNSPAFVALDLKPGTMTSSGLLTVKLSVAKAEIKKLLKPFKALKEYPTRGRQGDGLGLGSYILDARDTRVALVSYPAPLTTTLVWDRVKTPLSIIEPGVKGLVRTVEAQYVKAAKKYGHGDDRFDILDDSIVAQYTTMAADLCTIGGKSYSPCSKTKARMKKIETLKKQKAAADKKAAIASCCESVCASESDPPSWATSYDKAGTAATTKCVTNRCGNLKAALDRGDRTKLRQIMTCMKDGKGAGCSAIGNQACTKKCKASRKTAECSVQRQRSTYRSAPTYSPPRADCDWDYEIRNQTRASRCLGQKCGECYRNGAWHRRGYSSVHECMADWSECKDEADYTCGQYCRKTGFGF